MASSNASSDASGIIWGPWSRLPNGQWHREGQDSSGNWYEENQDEDPEQPRPQASLDSGGNDRAMKIQHQGKGRRVENPGQFESSHCAYDRGNEFRSPKSESEPRGKSSRPSRSDTKGNGKDTDLPPLNLPTADDDGDNAAPGLSHASLSVEDGVEKSPAGSTPTASTKPSSTYAIPLRTSRAQEIEELEDHHAYGPKQSLEDAADMCSGGKLGESSSSSTSILAPEDYVPADANEDVDGFLDLPGPSSYPKLSRSRTLQEIPRLNEDLSQYIVEKSRKFTFGTVFKVMWTEPLGNSRLSIQNKDPVNTGIPISEIGQRMIYGTTFYEGIRRFVVVDGTENGARNGNSICVPITTYKKQACTKRGIKPSQHGIIHTQDREPMLLNAEPDLGVSPIRLVVNRDLQDFEKLAPESRINYSKHVTIEHVTPVFLIGHIHPDDIDILAAGVDGLWEQRVRARKKDKKQQKPDKDEKHSSKQSNEETSRSAETPDQFPGRHRPDRMRPEGHQPDLKPDEHSRTKPRSIPPGPDHHRNKAAQQSDGSSLSQTVGERSAVIHKEPQKPSVFADSHVTISDTQDSQRELNSRFNSLTVSNNVMRDQNPQEEDTEVPGIRNVSPANSPRSPGSSICLTDTTSDAPSEESQPPRSQENFKFISRLVGLVTYLFQDRTQFLGDIREIGEIGETGDTGETGEIGKILPGEGTRAYAKLPSNQTPRDVIPLDGGNHATQSCSGTALPISTRKKRKHSHDSSGSESDDEGGSLSQSRKGKQKETQQKEPQMLGCPFVKRYGPKARCSNNNKGWPTTARVKEHLYRHHRQPIHCPRCYTNFKDQDAVDTHLREQKVFCDTAIKESIEGFHKASLRDFSRFSRKQESDLKSRKGLSNMTTEHEKWEYIYTILFPDTNKGQVPSPYFDPNDFEEPLLEHKRQKIARFVTYCVNKKLKTDLGEAYAPELRDAMFEVVNQALDKALNAAAADAELLEELCKQPKENYLQDSIVEPMGEIVKDVGGKEVTEAHEKGSPDAHNEQHNVEGHGVAAKDPSMQSSYQIGTSAVPPDDYLSGSFSFPTADQDPWNEILLQNLDTLMTPNCGPWMDYEAADPDYQQDTGVDKDTLVDSGIGMGSSTMSEGHQEWAT